MSKRYLEYVDSGVPWLGHVPAGWTMRPLWSMFERIKDIGHPDEQMLSVFRDYGVVAKDSRDNINKTAENRNIYQLVHPGWLVANRMKAWQGSVGISPLRGIVSGHYICFAPRHDADSRYLNWLFRSPAYTAGYALQSRGVRIGQAEIDNDLYRVMPVLLPPIEEQRAIADYLDRETASIDTLIEEQQSLIEMLREQRAAVVDAALAPVSSWTRTTLKHLLSGIDQGVSPQAEAGFADEPGTWGVLKTGCVNRGVFRPEEHKRLPSDFTFDLAIAVEVGDVIVSRASGSPDLVGSAAIVERLDYQLILSDKLFRLRPKQSVDPRFLVWSLNSGQYRVQVGRAISGAEGLANNLPLAKLRAFEMHHPSLEEQRRIAAHLDEQTTKIDMLIEETERLTELARERRAALITAAVTGQIDIREMA